MSSDASDEEKVLKLQELVDSKIQQLRKSTEPLVLSCASAETILENYRNIIDEEVKKFYTTTYDLIVDTGLKETIKKYSDDSIKNLALEMNSLADTVKNECGFKIHSEKNEKNKINGRREYDQLVRGDIKIKQIKNNSEYDHKITFYKNGKFLKYQVFNDKKSEEHVYIPDHKGRSYASAVAYSNDPSNSDKVFKSQIPVTINNDRDVYYVKTNDWVLMFNNINKKKIYTPTTVMEIGCKRYIFVLKKCKINKKEKLVFYISTKEIKLDKKLKHLTKIPNGKYKNVRFDIDSTQEAIGYCGETTSDASYDCWCSNPNTYVSLTNSYYIDTCGVDCSEFGFSHNYLSYCYGACNSSRAPHFWFGTCIGGWVGNDYTPPNIDNAFDWANLISGSSTKYSASDFVMCTFINSYDGGDGLTDNYATAYPITCGSNEDTCEVFFGQGGLNYSSISNTCANDGNNTLCIPSEIYCL